MVVISESDQPFSKVAAFLREIINREIMIGRKTSFPIAGRSCRVGWMRQVRMKSHNELAVTDSHPCEDEREYENQMRCEDDEKVDSGVLHDRFDETGLRHSYCADV